MTYFFTRNVPPVVLLYYQLYQISELVSRLEFLAGKPTIQDVLNEDQPCWNPPPCQHLLLCRP